MTRITSAKLTKMFRPSHITLKIQKLENKQCKLKLKIIIPKYFRHSVMNSEAEV